MTRFYHMSGNFKNYALETISFLFVLLFVYAATSKLLNFEYFRIQLEQFPFINTFAGSLAWTIPSVLLLVSLLFYLPKLRLKALYAALILLLLFSIYIIAVLNFAEAIPCSCGGVIASWSWNQHLMLNSGCILLAALGIAFIKKEKRGISKRKNHWRCKNILLQQERGKPKT